uniref:YjjG family noncanonical pyrimidine nucleotidase n=1 Tax=Polaribacter sp. TaxID=1920175 RepID=UPI0040486DAE
MQIEHVFFDLDHTLWDFEKNSQLTFQQIFNELHLDCSLDDFLKVYTPINFEYWKLYREEKITKEELRFGRLKDTFDALQIEVLDELIDFISHEYIRVLPSNNHLFDGVIDLLKYLHEKYQLHIITNGFEEVQQLKLENSGIQKYFKHVITSESVGVKKPNPKVFEHSLVLANTIAEKSIMIGDSLEADIFGALECGMKSIYFNSTGNFSPSERYVSVTHLLEIKQYL